MKTGLQWIEECTPDLVALSQAIWEYAEVSLKEHRSAAAQAAFLEKEGFSVKVGLAGMPSALMASFGEGKPVIGYLGEYDALPGVSQKPVSHQEALVPGGPGHGCGHNLLGVGSLAAAAALKREMEAGGLKGMVRYYGCPAEETSSGKGFMAKYGLFDDLDAAISWHPGSMNMATYHSNLALLKSGMSMLDYFYAFGPQVERMRRETGTVSAINGMLKAPLDVLGDKFRGYLGLAFDLMEIPDKVLAACQALMPHLAYKALTSGDPTDTLPIPIWMHRGCVPFISRDHFEKIYWATLKPIVDALWTQGNQVLFYAEGNWDAHLERFAELPAGSIIYHMDRSDPAKCAAVLGKKFCLSGGIPNALLAFGTPEEVRQRCKYVIDTCGQSGGYIMDASAIMQSDSRIENVKAMTDFTREYGVYGTASKPPTGPSRTPGLPEWITSARPRPGICRTWEDKLATLPGVLGDPAILERVWDQVEGLAYLYIWHIVLSF